MDRFTRTNIKVCWCIRIETWCLHSKGPNKDNKCIQLKIIHPKVINWALYQKLTRYLLLRQKVAVFPVPIPGIRSRELSSCHLFQKMIALLLCFWYSAENIGNKISSFLLSCPSSPSSSGGTFSDCEIDGINTVSVFYFEGENLTLVNCKFTNCINSGNGGAGGIAWASDTSFVYVYSCSFSHRPII